MRDNDKASIRWPKTEGINPGVIHTTLRFRGHDFSNTEKVHNGNSVPTVGVRMVLISTLLPQITARQLFLLCSDRATIAIVDEDDSDDYIITLEFNTEPRIN